MKKKLLQYLFIKKRGLTKLLQIMRLTIFLMLICIFQVSASVYSQNEVLTFENKVLSMRDVFKEVEKQSKFRFFYNDILTNIDKKVELTADKMKIDQVLNTLLSGTNLSFKILENNLIIISPTVLLQQQKLVGTVTDASNNEPIIGANVVIEGSTVGVVTDINGKFSLDIPKANVVLVISYLGFNTEHVTVSGQSSIEVKMTSDVTKLDEVVVVGYGIQKKKLVTGATIQVKGDDILKLNTVSPLTALQSQSPGVNIIANTGEPGSGFKVAIRGVGTINNSQPLYIVDGASRGDINYLNPSDIESIDILKDAASAAIYGARAANGVVLVTTKKGKAGKLSVSYDGYYGVQNLYKILPMLDAKEYMMIQNEGNMNSGGTPYDAAFWNSKLATGDYDRIMNGTWTGTNWLKQMQNKNAPIQSHSLNLSGGNETSTFSLGFSYLNQDGVMGAPVASHYERYTFRINSDHVIYRKRFDILKVGENVSFGYNKSRGIANSGFYWNAIRNAESAFPLLPMYGDATDPAYPYHSAILWNTNYSNPNAALVNNSYNTNFNINLNANVYLEFQPIKGLKFKSNYTVNPSASTWRSWSPAYNLGPVAHSTLVGTSQGASGGVGSWMFENTLNYEFSLLTNNHFNFLVGTSAEKYGLGTNLSVSNTGSIFNDFAHAYIDNANVPGTATISGSPWGPGALNSYFGRVNYDYKEKYMLSLIMRTDGSSNFAQGHRWGTFPSVSAGWVLSNESFMQTSRTFVDFLKLRGSWGQNGNQSIPAFQYLSNIGYNDPNGTHSNYYFGSSKTSPVSSLGAYPANIPTPDLKWETSEQLDLGLDARFVNSKLNVTLDYYVKTTKDWLVAAPILASWGVTNAPYINGGEIQNKGIEIALGWSDHVGDFRYGINGNFSHNKNNVTKIENSSHFITASNVKLWGNGPAIARAEVGHPLGYFWGYKTAGVFQNETEVASYTNSKGVQIMPSAQPGDVKFVDTNDDGVIDDKDKVDLGNGTPSNIFSLSFNCQYKGFDFSVTTYGVSGNKIARSWHDAGSVNDNYTTEILGRWHGEGTSNKLPRVLNSSSINQQYTSDLNIEDGSYLRISNVTLGYDFKNLYKSGPLNQMRLFMTVQNLFTFTKYNGMDPAVGTSTDDSGTPWVKGVDLGFYPNPRTIMVGASLKF
jgi:TonB-linked SusC/RagA family outer membrane protein